jgi:hypothetical protein
MRIAGQFAANRQKFNDADDSAKMASFIFFGCGLAALRFSRLNFPR